MSKRLKVLIMSVGPYATNWTAKYLLKIGAPKKTVYVCLPKQFSEFSDTYDGKTEVYIYDEQKYINEKFEYFGFKPRNCGGIGRQGIAELTELLDSRKDVLLELDDDTSSINIRKADKDGKLKAKSIKQWSQLEELVNAEDEFYQKTGIYCMASTGATPPKSDGEFIANRKVFNNFIMRKKNQLNYDGFKALCSDDYRFNIYNNLFNREPMVAHNYGSIIFHQSQGDREDGNAVLYNGDCSWKKSYALKMMAPWAVEQHIAKETNRVLFRENLQPSKLFPPICLSDKKGNIIGELK